MAEHKTDLKAELRDYAAGDKAAFARLYDAAASRLHNFVCAMLCDVAAAEDVLQDLFRRIIHEPKTFLRAANLESYLYQAARNLALDRRRLRRRDPAPLDADAIRFLRSKTDADPWVARMADDARAVFAVLDDDERELLSLRLFNDMSLPECAEALGRTLHQVRYQYEQTILKCKEKFREQSA